MHTIQIAKLKKDFSSIINEVEKKGEKYIIEYGKKHRKVAMIVPYSKSLEYSGSRCFGHLKGKLNISKDFNDEDPEINKMFYGNE